MKAVLFDMDGTMVDNMMVHHRAWQTHLASLGLPMDLDTVMKTIHGINSEIIERLFGDKYDDKEKQRIADEKEAAYRDIYDPELLPGLSSLLDELLAAGIPMAVASAAPRANVDFIIDRLDLQDYFQCVYASEDVKHGKPNPEVFLLAAETLGVAAEDCLIFEDSVTGAQAAERSGAKSIIVSTTHQPAEFTEIENIITFISDYKELSLSHLHNIT